MSRINNPDSFDPDSIKTDIGTDTSRTNQTPEGDKPDAPYEPTNVELHRLQFKHAGGILKLNDSLYSLVITESLFQNALTCKVELNDATEKLAELDPDGTEELRISFSSEKNRRIDHIFSVYRVEVYPDQESGSKGKGYQLFGISKEFMIQSTMDINRTFSGKISDFAKIVFEQVRREKRRNLPANASKNAYYNNRKLKDLHSTSGNIVLNVPGMTPFEAMKLFEKRAYNSKFSSSIFLFYEDFRGFHFANIEQIIAEGRNNPIKYKYKPSAQIDDQKTVEGQKVISHLAFPKGKNVLDKIKSGAYASQVAEIDIINQKVDRTLLTVKENFNDFYHLDKPAITYDKKEVIDRHLNTINSTTWINKYNDGLRHKENNFGPLLTRRKFYGDSLSQVQMNCVVPGNSDLSVGRILDLSMIETSANKDNPEQEKKISGKYLITEVNHQILKGKYNCTLGCNKDSFRANVTRIDDYIIGKR